MNDEDFISKFIKENPFDFKKGIIAHCRTLDKYDVYQWVADDEVKIKNLLEENQQLKGSLQTYEILLKANVEENQKLKEQLQQKEDIINKAREYIYEHARIDDEYPAYIEMLLEEKNELLEILDRKE